ncbi:MAG: metallophosphoesterase family protein [Planctomycetota bacterium]
MRIVLIGDVHGDLAGLARVVAGAARDHAVVAAFQVGDLGFTRALLTVDVPQFAVPVYAVCGNHDDHAFLAREHPAGFARHWRRRGLFYQARGTTRRFARSVVGFLGGAYHIDRPQRSDAYGANYLTQADIRRAGAAFAADRPDLIVSHSCPAGIGIGLRGDPDRSWQVHEHITSRGHVSGPADDSGEVALTELYRTVQPQAWVFGHFHRQHRALVDATDFLSLPPLAAGACWLWDAAARRLQVLASA